MPVNKENNINPLTTGSFFFQILTHKQLDHLFQNVILIAFVFHSRCNIFVRILENAKNSKSALWLLMAW